jgi:hypothetical protein
MISNGQRSGNRDDIAAEPMDGFSSLRSKQSWHKCSNSASRADTNLAVLRTTCRTAMTPSACGAQFPARRSKFPGGVLQLTDFGEFLRANLSLNGQIFVNQGRRAGRVS